MGNKKKWFLKQEYDSFRGFLLNLFKPVEFNTPDVKNEDPKKEAIPYTYVSSVSIIINTWDILLLQRKRDFSRY
jgi:hypothetical protein